MRAGDADASAGDDAGQPSATPIGTRSSSPRRPRSAPGRAALGDPDQPGLGWLLAIASARETRPGADARPASVRRRLPHPSTPLSGARWRASLGRRSTRPHPASPGGALRGPLGVEIAAPRRDRGMSSPRLPFRGRVPRSDPVAQRPHQVEPPRPGAAQRGSWTGSIATPRRRSTRSEPPSNTVPAEAGISTGVGIGGRLRLRSAAFASPQCGLLPPQCSPATPRSDPVAQRPPARPGSARRGPISPRRRRNALAVGSAWLCRTAAAHCSRIGPAGPALAQRGLRRTPALGAASLAPAQRSVNSARSDFATVGGHWEFRRGGHFCYCPGFVLDQRLAKGGGKAKRTGLCPGYRADRQILETEAKAEDLEPVDLHQRTFLSRRPVQDIVRPPETLSV